MVRYVVAVVAVVHGVIGCSHEETREVAMDQGAKKLSDAEIKAAVAGNTLSGTVDLGMITVKFDSFYAPDGRSSGIADTPVGEERDKGKWQVNAAGELCVKWSRWRKAKERCSAFFKHGDQYKVFSPEGKVTVTATVRPGNAKRLPL